MIQQFELAKIDQKLLLKVSKLNGRNIRVRGSSFILSIKTKIDAVINVFFISGILTFINENIAGIPKERDASFIFLQFLSIPESIGCHATAKKRVIKAKININKLPDSIMST